MERIRRSWRHIPSPVRKLLVAVIGVAVIAAGVAMLVLPGPGWATIFLGLAILATEFAIAERAKQFVMNKFKQAAAAATRRIKR